MKRFILIILAGILLLTACGPGNGYNDTRRCAYRDCSAPAEAGKKYCMWHKGKERE